MTKKILTIDVGNTSVSFGIFQDGKRTLFFSAPTARIREYGFKGLKSKINKSNVCVMCSVVPTITNIIKREMEGDYNVPLWIVGKDMVCKVKHCYKNEHKLGVDRKVAVYGALKKFTPPFIVIDFGTAITFDYVDKHGVFLGGLIVPGLETSYKALLEKGALLPKVLRIEKPKLFLGTSTVDCIKSGTVYGFAALTDGLINEFKKRYSRNVTCIATGGMAAFIKPYCKHQLHVRPHLTLESLHLMAKAQDI